MRQVIEFDFALPGLNGPEGLMREHWSKRKKRKDDLVWQILEKDLKSHQGQVRITYTRNSPKLFDWFDNLPSSGKFLMDALVKARVIKDDSPEIIPFQPVMFQNKGKARTQIIIEDLE